MSSYSLCSSRRINSSHVSGGTNKPRCDPQSLSRSALSISSIRENTFKHHRILFNDAIREFIHRIIVFPKVSKNIFKPAGRIGFLEIAGIIEATLSAMEHHEPHSLDEVIAAATEARRLATERIGG